MDKIRLFVAGFAVATLLQVWLLTYINEDAKIALKLAHLDGVREGSKQANLKCLGLVRE